MKWTCINDNFPKENFYRGLQVLSTLPQPSEGLMFVVIVDNLQYIASYDTIDKLPFSIEEVASKIEIWQKIE